MDPSQPLVTAAPDLQTMASQSRACDAPVRATRSRSPRRCDDNDVIVVYSDVASDDIPPLTLDPTDLLDDSQEDVIGDPLNESILQQKIQEWMSEQLRFPERFRVPGQDLSSRITRLRGELEEVKREVEEEFQREVERVTKEMAEEAISQ